MTTRSMSLLAVLLCLAAAGCAPQPPYLRGYRFAPEPALAVMFKPGTQTPAVSVMASVIGIRRGDPDKGIAPAVEIRMRFENNGQEPATFDPKSLSLVTGALQALGPPEVHAPVPVEVAPGQLQLVSAFFPFPPGMNLQTLPVEALRLRWQVTIDGKPYLQTVVFERASPLYY